MTLEDCLKDSLPLGEEFEIFNLQSPPRETSPIVFPEAGGNINKKNENIKTVKTQHFVALCHSQKVVFAVEIVVYFTIYLNSSAPTERLLFVSKADTNGYCSVKLNVGRIVRSIIAFILAIDPNHYLQKVKPGVRKLLASDHIIRRTTPVRKALKILSERKLDRYGINSKVHIPEHELYVKYPAATELITQISLFTRAEPQYLFSDSSKNPNKHILSGDKLLLWWLRIIDQVIVESFDDTTKATLQIPGEEKRIIANYLRRTKYKNWTVGDIFSKDPQDIALYRIPLFPDDPKGRFLEHLASDGRIHKVTVSTFWTELQARQEFRLGSTVSVIGVSGRYTGITNVLQPQDIVVTMSKNEFKNLKNYITGEEYDTSEGAEEAYMNIRDILKNNYASQMVKITGNFKSQVNAPQQNTNTINVINTLSIHRKPRA
ncbi:histone acetyltransferase RTT109 [Kluyveromyces marxianus DMKU3-1042]|uniref:histone acetyltransferase n=1 Tax=Kluyveromyces marxianus (strain DMKU3-1042 / BCC 29191 / NBRC 104275) TaxID=1003335 RepID=W0T900_KLUMD|nr:H3 histone acetyltransferase RTT109 [Kluyveromyces marxianus DMKU3-1042]BAO38569.1 histone acetyltransferase RTT109 [Kluyveromyces marxianus DMKU3-1042]